MCDALVVTTDKHFLAAKSQNGQMLKLEIKDGFNNPIETMLRFTGCPEVLNRPVHDVVACCKDIGVSTMGSPHPLQTLLAEFSGLPVICYRIHLVAWLKRHAERECLTFLMR